MTGAAPPIRLHACTIDVEDFYHVTAFDGVVSRSSWGSMPDRVTANTERLLALLADAGVRATFFILGRVAERAPRLVRAIRGAGHDLGCHSDDHRLVYQMSPAEFRADLRTAKRRIEDAAGCRVTAYRAPTFSITAESLWALETVAAEGFTHDSSIYPVLHDRYGMPSAPVAPYVVMTRSGPLTEFPPTSFRFLGRQWPGCGGGYFRLSPYWLSAWMIRHSAAQGRPASLYLHPWELDPNQPRVPGIGWRTRFRHYVGLRKTAPRFVRLLKEFPFGTLLEALAPLPSLPEYRVIGCELEPVASVRRRMDTPGLPVPAGAP